METFTVDKSFYDIGTAEELKELWEADLDPEIPEVLKMESGDMTIEWCYLSKNNSGVILHDRLMTDAALGTRPIKTEHSYSLTSDGDSLPHSPNKVDGTPVEERVTKPSRPIIKSLHVENNLVETNLERSQSLNQVNTNRWGDRYSFQRNNKEQYEEPVEHSKTPEKFIGSESSETSNQNLPSENLEQTATNDLYMNYDYQEVTPVTEYKIHGSNNKNPLTFLTSSLEERNKNVENGEDNFERQMPPLIFSEQNEENTPSRKFKIKDTEDQFRVHFVQIDSNHEYPVSEEELFEDEEDISEYKAMGYSSQAASIFFGEYEAPKVNRPRRIVFSSNGEGPAENDC